MCLQCSEGFGKRGTVELTPHLTLLAYSLIFHLYHGLLRLFVVREAYMAVAEGTFCLWDYKQLIATNKS